jgi:Exonuclease VII, large subunit
MSRTAFHVVVFLVGLLAVCWIGIGYVSVHPLGAAVAAIIAACYIAGGVELYRYRQASNGLRAALNDLSSAKESLAPWLERVPVGLRNAVRLRVEGERTALPAPVLTPYLVGLLVLLGMLGTLLGMMDTLRGTGLALQSATDMAAIRGSLASPVQGLAVAFGTSIAGVASSAMLGLLAALLRRDRLQAVQQLDRAIAGDLHPYSQAWQRAESLRLLQAQSAALPALVDRLQAMTQTFEQHSTAANERLLAGQAEFLIQSQALQERLAVSLQQSLREGAEASAAAIGGALQPMAETTLAGLAHHSEALHARVEQAVQEQLAGLSDGFERSRVATEASWAKVVSEQSQAQQALVDDLRQHLLAFSDGQGTQAEALVARIGERLQVDANGNAEAWRAAIEQQQALNSALVERQQQALLAAGQQLDEHAQALLRALEQRHDASQSLLQDHEQQRSQQWQAAQAAAAAAHAELQACLDTREQQRQARWDAVSAELQQAHAALHAQLQAGDEQRLQRWSDALQHVSTDLAERLRPTASAWLRSSSRSATRWRRPHSRSARTVVHRPAQRWPKSPPCCRPRQPRRRPLPTSSTNCAARSLKAWCVTTQCWKNAVACWPPCRPCSMRSTMPRTNSAPPWTRWLADRPSCWSASATASPTISPPRPGSWTASPQRSTAAPVKWASWPAPLVKRSRSSAVPPPSFPAAWNRLAAHWMPRWPAAMSSWPTTWRRRARWSTSACCRRSK